MQLLPQYPTSAAGCYLGNDAFRAQLNTLLLLFPNFCASFLLIDFAERPH